MTTHYKYLGNISNIPPFPEWSEFISAGETIAESIPSLQESKHQNRLGAARRLSEQLGYADTDVGTITGTAADPKDFDRWWIHDTSVIERIGELIGFRKPGGRVQVLTPGSMQPLHLDNLEYSYISPQEPTLRKLDFSPDELEAFHADQRTANRVLILLQDWRYGQGMTFGNETYTGWRAGDIVAFDWPTCIHSTYNTGYWNRPMLRLTGLVTQRFDQFLNADTPFQFDYIGG